jgi:hypothetical protein
MLSPAERGVASYTKSEKTVIEKSQILASKLQFFYDTLAGLGITADDKSIERAIYWIAIVSIKLWLSNSATCCSASGISGPSYAAIISLCVGGL